MKAMSRHQYQSNDVVITGIGVISPVGLSKVVFWDALVGGHSGIKRIETFDSSTYPTQVAGEIRDFDATNFMSHKESRRMDRSCQMIVAAAQLAIDDSSIDLRLERNERVGVFTGTAVGGQAWAFREYGVFLEKGLNRINPFTAISTFPNASSAQISGRLGLLGPSVTISSGCVSGTLALGYAVDNIRLGRIDVALVGGTEAPLEPGIFGAYCAARVMTVENCRPTSVPRPFDLHRDGIVLSEGAGVLICESVGHAMRRGARVYATVDGWFHNSDSASMMMIKPDGVQGQRVAENAIADANLQKTQIDCIFAHAAGTRSDDKTEAEILQRMFACRHEAIPVTALKSLLGHTQGACGVIEGAAAALSIFHEIIPPTVNCDIQDPECAINLVKGKPLNKKIRALLMNTFGFGGKNVSVVFSAWDQSRVSE